MLGDLSGVSKIFVITGRTDRRKTSDNTIRNLRQTIVNLEETIAELNRRFFGISSEHSKNISLPADEESDMAEDISEDDAKESPLLLTNC